MTYPYPARHVLHLAARYAFGLAVVAVLAVAVWLLPGAAS